MPSRRARLRAPRVRLTVAAEDMTSPSRRKTMFNTVVSQFRTQLKSLLAVVNQTSPHFIRCLKPNPECVPRVLDRPAAVAQLRCGGVLEAARVSRLGTPCARRRPCTPLLQLLWSHAGEDSCGPSGCRALPGYPIRLTHSEFVARYGCLAPSLPATLSARDRCQRILANTGLEDSLHQAGTTRVFLRKGLRSRWYGSKQGWLDG